MARSMKRDMLLGALVADAASLGTHWIYEPSRIAEIAARHGGSAAFAPIEAANYEGVPSYVAHGARRQLAFQFGHLAHHMGNEGVGVGTGERFVAALPRVGPGGGVHRVD